METLNRLGVGLSEFGERTFMLDALPPFVKSADSRKFVLELVDKLQATGEGVNALRLGEDMIAKTVCRHAVKANDSLREEELQGLVDDLRRCEMPYTCPHGRPTLIEMSYPGSGEEIRADPVVGVVSCPGLAGSSFQIRP